MPPESRERGLQVDHDSLRSTAITIQKAADRLEDLVRRTLAATPGRSDGDRGAPGAEFDDEYDGILQHAPQAYTALIGHLNGIADKITTASANHRAGEAASIASIRRGA
ncbi:type VII secretion target [Streptosporangium sp. NPDC000396]|uniref:type VII secretion target n=1 Tax=Streptosporangium sp. NPDC000396 TaxID=3366185 RepID=UPI0036C5370F